MSIDVLRGNGSAWGGGAGGGGRISIVYDSVAQSNMPPPKISILAASGKYGSSGADGDLGTLYFPDNQLFTRYEGDISFSGRWLASNEGKISRASTSLINCWLRFPEDGFTFDAGSSLSILGADIAVHRFEMTNGTLVCDGDIVVNKATLTLRAADAGGPVVNCGECCL